MRFGIALFWLGLLPVAGQTPASAGAAGPSQNLAPSISSPQPIVDRMLELGRNQAGRDRLRPGLRRRPRPDLRGPEVQGQGCGNRTLLQSRADDEERVKSLNLENQVKITQGSLLNIDLQPADVVILYLDTGANDMLKPKLEKQLKPGARVVSHDFEVRGWKPAKVEKMKAYNRTHTIFLY